MAHDGQRQRLAVFVPRYDLPQVQSRLTGVQTQIASREPYHAGGRIAQISGFTIALCGLKRIQPPIAQSLAHAAGDFGRPGDAVLAGGYGKIIIADPRIIQKAEACALAQVKDDLLIGRGRHPARLRRNGTAQIRKSQHAVNHTGCAHHQIVPQCQVQARIAGGQQHPLICRRHGRLRFLRLWRLAGPQARIGHPDGVATQQQIEYAQRIVENEGIIVEMPHLRAIENGVIEHDGRVDECRDGKADAQAQQPAVARQHIGRQKQRQGG